MGRTEYLTTDECSMIYKEMLAMTSEITTDVRVSMELGSDKLSSVHCNANRIAED